MCPEVIGKVEDQPQLLHDGETCKHNRATAMCPEVFGKIEDLADELLQLVLVAHVCLPIALPWRRIGLTVLVLSEIHALFCNGQVQAHHMCPITCPSCICP